MRVMIKSDDALIPTWLALSRPARALSPLSSITRPPDTVGQKAIIGKVAAKSFNIDNLRGAPPSAVCSQTYFSAFYRRESRPPNPARIPIARDRSAAHVTFKKTDNSFADNLSVPCRNRQCSVNVRAITSDDL